MADIFISHSGQDNEVAAAIGERIQHDRPTWSLRITEGQRLVEAVPIDREAGGPPNPFVMPR